jgi:hypothetical protein
MSTNPQAVPFLVQKFLYINECKISNDATTPNTILNVSAGICRDNSDTYDLNIGNYDNFNNGQTANSSTSINAANNGINGLDTGSLLASKVYYVYVIADPVSANQTGAMISLAAPSVGPLMPFGYSAYRHIGYAVTDSSVHFLKMYNSGNNNARVFTYDAAQATSVTAGTSATYAAINLSALVPAVDNLMVTFRANWTANAAADVLNMQGGNATGDQWTAIAPVAGATAHTVAFGQVLSQLVATVPTSNYKVSAVGGVAINVSGFAYYI